jgi:hypothetical protein
VHGFERAAAAASYRGFFSLTHHANNQPHTPSQTNKTAGADERRALAGAVRLPQLEPLMLATVVPRMGWLAEVLGVEGLALAAGAARGQYDVAAGACVRYGQGMVASGRVFQSSRDYYWIQQAKASSMLTSPQSSQSPSSAARSRPCRPPGCAAPAPSP